MKKELFLIIFYIDEYILICYNKIHERNLLSFLFYNIYEYILIHKGVVIMESSKLEVHDDLKNSVSHTYIIQNLDCAHCGSKIESAINDLPEVNSATLIFATKKLFVTAENHSTLLPKMQEVAKKIEHGVILLDSDNILHNSGENSNLKMNLWIKENKDLLEITLGGILFILAFFLEDKDYIYNSILFFIPYLILGRGVLINASKNILRGNIFDENFLMSIATIGALVINAWEEAVGVMLFYRIGEFFEHKAIDKSRSQIMQAIDMRPEIVNLLDNGTLKSIPAERIKVGDVILVKPGERIPLDSVIIKGECLLDTSSITGEYIPIKCTQGDHVMSGSINTNAVLNLKVEKVLAESMVTRILESVEHAAASKPAVDRFITKFARIYTPIVVLLALFIAIIPPLFTGEWEKWVYTALTFLVISCPCALVLSIPLAFFGGIGAASKQGILFKGGAVIETLKNIKAVVMDKTGTLTKGNFIVQKIKSIVDYSEDELLKIAASAESLSLHPIAKSIIETAHSKKIILDKPDKFLEFAGEGIVAYLNGKRILCGNSKLLKRFAVKCENLNSDNLGTHVLLAENDKFLGEIIISDTVKEDAAVAVKNLHKQGIKTAILTGDEEKSTKEVADNIGISDIYTRLLPQDKFVIMKKIREQYGPVMFVGDGINDAPVLAGADVGAAMGSGTDAAIEAGDVVFMNSKIQAIVQAINIAKRTDNIAWQNIVFALSIKIIIMLAGILGHASMWAAVFADTGVLFICVLNSMRVLYKK